MKRLLAAIAVVAACSCAGVDTQVDRILIDAQTELRRGQTGAARALVDRGLEVTHAAPHSVPAWRIRLLAAEVAIAQQEMAAALKDLETAAPAGEAFDAIRARQKYLRAVVHLAQGQLQPALQALEAATSLGHDDADLLQDIEIAGSQARLRLGQWDEAERRLNAALNTASTRSDRYREALAINNLGMSRLVRRRFDDALPHFERVLSYGELEQTRIYAQSLNNAGICLARLGEYDQALKAQQRAVEIHERGGRTTDLMRALGELGTTHLLRGDLSEALPHLKRALDIATKGGLMDEAWVWASNLAVAEVSLGHWDEASRYNDEARRLNPPDRPAKLFINTATDAQVAAGRGDTQKAVGLYGELLTASAKEPSMLWVAHSGLAKLAAAAGQTSVAATHFDAALQTIEKTRSALLRADYRVSFLTRVIAFYSDYVDFLMANGRVDRALEIADSSRGRVLAERLDVAAPSRGAAATFRKHAADSGQVFVFYWLSSVRSLAWVVSAAGIRSFQLPPRNEIEPLVDKYHAQILNTSSDPLATSNGPGEQLYARIVAPLAAALPRNARLVIVPDRSLHRLNFETLPVRSGDAAHYWVEDVTIQIAPSLSLMTPSKPAGANQKLLLVGNPTPRAPEFPALSYAAAEMDGVSKSFGSSDVTVLRAEQASPAAFRGAKPEQYSRIHFTTHAIANTESPMDSAVILSGPDSAFKLYARDVAEMPLTADLVTVSACRSAGDRAYSGEGLVGFAWAFLRAGSRRVVAGLWDVDDRSTAALMSDFYTRLATGEAAPAALRSAKLAQLRERKMRPYYWAPLQMFTTSP